MDIRSDFHTHTNLSACAADEVTAQALIDGLCTGEDGLRVLGISNHLWDSDIEGASEWYKPQNVEHVISIRKELENVDTHGARILVGAEVEYSGDCRVAITREHAALFDYLLITANHIHMKDFIIPSSMTAPEEVREFIVSRFLSVCEVDLPVKCGICHPFFPMSFPKADNEILAGITDEVYGKCFEKADRIYVLDVPRYQYRYRIIRRFIRRKLGLEKGKKETLKSLSDLLKWADKYQNSNLAEIRKILKAFPEKIVKT